MQPFLDKQTKKNDIVGHIHTNQKVFLNKMKKNRKERQL